MRVKVLRSRTSHPSHRRKKRKKGRKQRKEVGREKTLQTEVMVVVVVMMNAIVAIDTLIRGAGIDLAAGRETETGAGTGTGAETETETGIVRGVGGTGKEPGPTKKMMKGIEEEAEIEDAIRNGVVEGCNNKIKKNALAHCMPS
mmetsp:Transcript_24627/g.43737  ORF Transcript_24627/g.43737 Transcript_24627/m.43737 type:complete len:144 (+) Transcript_24627:1-432(+)